MAFLGEERRRRCARRSNDLPTDAQTSTYDLWPIQLALVDKIHDTQQQF